MATVKKSEAKNDPGGRKDREGAEAKFYEPKRLPPAKVSFADIDLGEALSRAEGAIAAHKDAFLDTAQSDIRRLLNLIQPRAGGPHQEPALWAIKTIALHLREHGGMFDYPLVTNVAKSLFDFAEGNSSFAAKDLGLLTVYANSLRLLFEEQVEGYDSARGKEIVNVLEQAVSHHEGRIVAVPEAMRERPANTGGEVAKGHKNRNSALVNDDDPEMGDFMRIVLAESGLNVTLEKSYESALKNFPAMDWSIVVAAIYMEGMGGIKGIKRIREVSADVKILAISAGHGRMNVGDTLRAAIKIGADASLAKPLDVETLTKAILPFIDK